MTIDARPTTTEPRSRRAILAGALTGLAGLIAGRAAAPNIARAASGDPLIIGSTANNAGTGNTTLTTSSTGTGLLITQNGTGTALRGSAVGPGSIAGFFTAQNGTGISGVTGNAGNYGVFAQNNGAAGTAGALRANGGQNHGIVASTANTAKNAISASTNAEGGVAILAINTNPGFDSTFGTGIRALSGGGTVADIHPGGQGFAAAGEFAGVIGVLAATNSGDTAVIGLGGATGDGVRGIAADGSGVQGSATTGIGVTGISTDGNAVWGHSTNSDGVHGEGGGNGVTGISSNAIASGVYGENVDGYGAAGRATGDGYGVYGVANGAGAGVWGIGTANVATSTGVLGETWATTSDASGVRGKDNGGTATTSGVRGITTSTNGSGISGMANMNSGSASGVLGTGVGIAAGVKGTSVGGAAIVGQTIGGTGVYGTSSAQTGVYGFSTNGTGVFAGASSASATALDVLGKATVTGNLAVSGTVSKGGGSFKIDHPLDPANKFLYHSFVESPDMMNIYNGIATLDAKGEAVVKLPAWFGTLNREFRYQLTPIGKATPDLHVKSKLKGNAFSIGGGSAGQEVSWQLTGIRQDAWANAHRVVVEEAKPKGQKGLYLHPKENSQPASKGIGFAERKAIEARLPKPSA
jgi:hypothetical protein